MKKFIVGALMLSSMSCSDNNDTINEEGTINNNVSIVGVWKMQSKITISGSDETTVLNEYFPDACKKQSTYVYTSNGKYTSNDFNNTGGSCVKTTVSSDYVYNASQKTIILNSSTEAKVLEITSSKLVIYVMDNYDYNSDGVYDYLKYIYTK